MMKLINMNEKEKAKIRKPILKELQKLIKKYGGSEVRYTWNWFYLRERARISRENKIKKMQEEIDGIKSGKAPMYY